MKPHFRWSLSDRVWYHVASSPRLVTGDVASCLLFPAIDANLSMQPYMDRLIISTRPRVVAVRGRMLWRQ